MADPSAGLVKSRFVQLPGLRMLYVSAGPEDGVPVILLHGFPEFSYSWRYQIPALVQSGLRVIAPDQRGYNLTGKDPPFGLNTLVEDIVNLQDALGISSSHLAGHDWGGAVAWQFAEAHPERTRKLVILNAPYLPAYRDTIRHHPAQLLKSGYIFFFQLPWLPEALFRANHYAFVERTFGKIGSVRMDPEDIRLYKTACAQPGALSAMLGWYRANFWGEAKRETHMGNNDHKISTPTCVIWGERDPFLDCHLNDPLDRYVPDLQIHTLPEGNHWVQMSHPDQVNSLMAGFYGMF